MEVRLKKSEFLGGWGIAESCAADIGGMSIFSAVLFSAEDDETTLQSTDIRTSIKVKASGVEIIEPGAATLPVRGVSDLFNKAGSDEMLLKIKDGRATLTAGKGRYRFSTLLAEDFPNLPTAADAKPFFRVKSQELVRALECGSLCAKAKETYPTYLCSVYLDPKGGVLNIASTDKNKLALYRCEAELSEGAEPLLIPLNGIRELLKILRTSKSSFDVQALKDDSQIYFIAENIEFSLRSVEGKFPNYMRIVSRPVRVKAVADRNELLTALERVNIVVRDGNRAVTVEFPGDGECFLSGRTMEFGEAHEIAHCAFSGEPFENDFNVGSLISAVKACEGPSVNLAFTCDQAANPRRSADADQLAISGTSSDCFTYILPSLGPANPAEESAEEADIEVS